MTVAKLAAALIRLAEGCKLKAYWDKTGKVWTIGFGHTRDVKEGDVITYDQAVAFLEHDMVQLIARVQDRPLVEAAALVSFGYNCGAGALVRYLKGEIKIEEWTKSGGVELPGLVARRQLEAALIEAARNDTRRT